MRLDEQPDAVIESLRHLFERQRSSFRQCTPLGLGKRLEALDILLQSIVNRQDPIIEAVKADFGQRSAAETRLLEIFPLVDEIRYLKRNLRRWMQTRSATANWQFLPSRKNPAGTTDRETIDAGIKAGIAAGITDKR